MQSAPYTSKESIIKSSNLTSTSHQSLMRHTFNFPAQQTNSASALQRIGALGELESRAKDAGDDLGKYRDMLLWKQEEKRVFLRNRGKRVDDSPKKKNMLQWLRG